MLSRSSRAAAWCRKSCQDWLLQYVKHAVAEQPFLWQDVWCRQEGGTAFVPLAARLRRQPPRPGVVTQQGHAVLLLVHILITFASNHVCAASIKGCRFEGWKLLLPCPAPCAELCCTACFFPQSLLLSECQMTSDGDSILHLRGTAHIVSWQGMHSRGPHQYSYASSGCWAL